VCFPNLPDPITGIKLLPGAKTALWSFDHDLGKWVIRGSMTISADGNLACSDPGVGLLSPGWHGAGPGSPGGSNGGGAGGGGCNSGCCSDCCGSPNNEAVQCCQNPPPPPPSPPPTNPVHPVSGEKYETATDLRIKGVGFDFIWQRSYRSRDGLKTAMGNNWDFSYNLSLEPDGFLLKVNEGTSRQYAYRQEADGKFTRAAQASEVKTNSTGGFKMTMADGRTLEYQPFDGSPQQGKIVRMSDRFTNTMRFFYDAEGRLIRMNDTLNRDITITYNADGFIESVTDFTGRSVRYAYYRDFDSGGSFGDLKSVTTPAVIGTPNTNDFPNGKTTIYTYTRGFADDRLNHNLLTITDGRRNDPSDPTFGQGPYLVNVYAPVTDTNDIRFDRVIRQYRGGDSVDLTYVPIEATLENNLVYMRTIVRDRNGNVIEYDYQVSNQLVAERHYTGRSSTNSPVTATSNRPVGKLRSSDPDFFETRHEYNSNLMLTRTIHPNGNITEMVYESDLNPGASPRNRNNVRIKRQLPGSHLPVGDQSVIEERFEYDTDFAGGCGSCGFNFVTKHADGRGNVLFNQYDAFGNLIARTNRISSIVDNWEYNARGQMTRHALPNNGSGHRRVDAMTYYDSGPMNGYLKEEIVDLGGFNLTTTYEHDAVGNVVRRIDPRRHDTQYIVNQLDQVVREISPEVTEGSGICYRKDYAYDANNNLKRIDVENRDENGALYANSWLTTTFEYEILNKQIRKTEEVDATHNIVTEFGYDANHNHTVTRWGEATAGRQTNNVMLVLYDERDLPFRQIRAPGSPKQSTTQYDYDANGNRIRVSDGLEDQPHLTSYAFDGYNRLVSSLDAMGNISTNNFDAVGNRTRTMVLGELNDVEGSANNVRLNETFFGYDPMNRMTNQSAAFFSATNQAPTGSGFAVAQTLYNDNSSVFAMINANNHGTTNLYDTANRLSVQIDAKGNSVTNGYDANGNLVLLTEVEKPDLGGPDERFLTAMFYDGLNRLTATSNNVGSVNRSLYDSRGNRAATIDALTNKVLFAYDGLNRLTQTTRLMTDTGNGLGAVVGQIVTRQTWDDSSRLTSQIDDNGNATTYVYDGLNRKFSTVFADGTGQTNQLDVHGSAILFTDGNGNRVTNSYDALDRLVRRDVGVGPGVSPDTTFEIYQYDGLSRLIRAEDNDSLVLRAYDSQSRVLQEIQNGAVVGAVFDAVGNQTQLSYPGGRVVNTTFDELERMKTTGDTNGMIATYNYVGPRRVARRDYGNGTLSEYSHNGLAGVPNPTGDFGSRNIVRTRHTKVADASVVDDRTYTWDRIGNKTARKDVRLGGPQIAQAVGYDSVYRMTRSIRQPLVGAGNTNGYVFDGVGNRLSVTGGDDSGAYTMANTLPEPADHQVNQYTTTPFDGRAYDRDGNLNAVTGTNAQVFVFDYRNQLVEFQGNGSAARYGYDVFGRRISRRVSGSLNEALKYVYSEFRICEETQTNSNLSATYTFGIFIDELLTVQRAGTNYFAHADDLHTVLALSDASGALVESYRYSDFGKPSFFDSAGASTAAPRSGNVILFTGRRFDAESELYEYRTRHLDPRAGRFISRDLIGVWGDIANAGNAFTYVANNPFSWVDPDGKIAGAGGSVFRPWRPKPPSPFDPPPCSPCVGCSAAFCEAECDIAAKRMAKICVLGCIFTGPGYGACVATCGGRAAILYGFCLVGCDLCPCP